MCTSRHPGSSLHLSMDMVALTKRACSAFNHFPSSPSSRCIVLNAKARKRERNKKGSLNEDIVITLVSPNEYFISYCSLSIIRLLREKGWHQITLLMKDNPRQHLQAFVVPEQFSHIFRCTTSEWHSYPSFPSHGGHHRTLDPNLTYPPILALRLAGLCGLYHFYFSGVQNLKRYFHNSSKRYSYPHHFSLRNF